MQQKTFFKAIEKRKVLPGEKAVLELQEIHGRALVRYLKRQRWDPNRVSIGCHVKLSKALRKVVRQTAMRDGANDLHGKTPRAEFIQSLRKNSDNFIDDNVFEFFNQETPDNSNFKKFILITIVSVI